MAEGPQENIFLNTKRGGFWATNQHTATANQCRKQDPENKNKEWVPCFPQTMNTDSNTAKDRWIMNKNKTKNRGWYQKTDPGEGHYHVGCLGQTQVSLPK